MLKHISAIIFIYFCSAIAWLVLGGTVQNRTHDQDDKLRKDVQQIWGVAQIQQAPTVYWLSREERLPEQTEQIIIEERQHPLPLQSSRIDVDLALDHRRKGLLWYTTYRVGFAGEYAVENITDEPRELFFDFALPDPEAVYDGFKLVVGDETIRPLTVTDGRLRHSFHLAAGASQRFLVSYTSQGLDDWWYRFGADVSQVYDFELNMHTDFDAIDFPPKSIAATHKQRQADGWALTWRYEELFTGTDIGMRLPQKLNPGPWVSKVCFAAPVSLFLYFFLFFVFSTLKDIKLHPMHFFFVAAAFFSFHLLLAYLVDHLSVHTAFAISSLVSIFLVASYLRQVVNSRFAFVEAGIAQLVYLVLFSSAFFFEGYAGLAITTLAVTTLFAAMQLTGRLDWEQAFANPKATGIAQ